jgi:adenylate cyclase
MRLLVELSRRKVLRTAAIYVAAAWLLLQVAELLLQMLEVPAWGLKLVFVMLVVGFPIALILSWTLQVTPQGLKREIAPSAAAAPADKPPTDDSATRAGAEPRVRSPEAASDLSIAVLPFDNMSDDPANVHFADGLSEELLNLLSRIATLRVVARTSSFSFKGRAVGATAIARELGVAHLLEGSVRKSGNRIRITAQLIRGSDASHVWSQTYDRDLTDIFAVQDEIASAVVDELEVKLLGVTAPKSWRTDPEAYAHFLRGRQFLDLASTEGYARAITELEATLRIDPRFGPAWAVLGALYWGQANNSLIDYAEGARRARAHAEKAHQLDPTLADPLSLLGYLDAIEHVDVAGGLARMERASRIEPNTPRILTRLANVLIGRGRLDDAMIYCRRALRADPLSALAHAVCGNACYFAGNLEEAETLRRRVLVLSPGWLSGHFYLGRVLLARGDIPAALAEMQLEQSEFWRLTGLAIVRHAMGQPAESDAALEALSEFDLGGAAYQLAQIHGFRGEADAAFGWLDRAVATHDAGLVFVRVDPLLAALHGDPRWEAFLAGSAANKTN